MDRFVLTFHDNTLFILDPEEGKIIGVLSLQYSISSLATSGGNIFLMCQATNSKKIIKLSIQPSLVKMKSSPFLNAGRFAGNLSAASSRANSREGLDQIHIDKDGKNDGTASPKLSRIGQKEERILTDEGDKAVHIARVEENSPADSSNGCKESVRVIDCEKNGSKMETDSPVVEGSSGDVEKDSVSGRETIKNHGLTVEETAALVQRQNEVEESEVKNEECVLEKESLEAKWLTDVDVGQTESEQAAAKATDNKVIEQPENPSVVDTIVPQLNTSSATLESVVDTTLSTDNSGKLAEPERQTSPTKKESESEKESGSTPEHSRGKSIIPTLVLAQGISHVKADLKEIKGALKLGKLTEFISQATHHSPTLQRKSDHHSTYSVSNDVVRLSTDPPSADQDVRATPTAVALPTVDPEEQRRRLRLAKMVEREDEDVVVATKSQTKARKTRKRRTKKSSKHSSATSES